MEEKREVCAERTRSCPLRSTHIRNQSRRLQQNKEASAVCVPDNVCYIKCLVRLGDTPVFYQDHVMREEGEAL